LFYSPIAAIFPTEALTASTVSSSPFSQPAFALGAGQAASLRPHLFQRSGHFWECNDPLSNRFVQYPERPVHWYLLLFRGFAQVPVTGWQNSALLWPEPGQKGPRAPEKPWCRNGKGILNPVGEGVKKSPKTLLRR